MNRTALAIRMLQILKTRRIIKKGELAALLETNPRNIIELKGELETAGYVIETINGKAGGYRLAEASLLPVSALTPDQQQAVQSAYTYLCSLSNYPQDQAFHRAFEKLLFSTQPAVTGNDFTVIGSSMSLPIKTLLDYYQRIRTAINQKTRLIIDYQPKNKLIEHWTIHPYELFQYKDMWYLLGYRQKTALAEGKIITLKLNRIRQLETTDISFYFPDDFKLHDYVTSFGMAIGPKQDVVLKIKNRFYISEYLYGENQTITSLDDETVILSVVMQGEISIKQLVMSLGSDCEVLKPEWLKAAIIEESRKLLANY